MAKWNYSAQDRNRNETGSGTVEAKDWPNAHTAASKDARSKGVPFYNLVVSEQKR